MIDFDAYERSTSRYAREVSGLPKRDALSEVQKLMQNFGVSEDEKEHVLAKIYNKSPKTTQKGLWERFENYLWPDSGFASGFGQVPGQPPAQVQVPVVQQPMVQQPAQRIQQPMQQPMQQQVKISAGGVTPTTSYNAAAGAVGAAQQAVLQAGLNLTQAAARPPTQVPGANRF